MYIRINTLGQRTIKLQIVQMSIKITSGVLGKKLSFTDNTNGADVVATGLDNNSCILKGYSKLCLIFLEKFKFTTQIGILMTKN